MLVNLKIISIRWTLTFLVRYLYTNLKEKIDQTIFGVTA